ncbi:MAG TPA: VWA domain-containing protein [Candidatus Angelobacter sp.]|jgi:VWFA-related protein|nr:VWA domain-containing protein [Candidatus Angelobacter sp.]
MSLIRTKKSRTAPKGNHWFLPILLLAITAIIPFAPVAQAQNGQPQPSPSATPAVSPTPGNAPAEAGGPQGDIGPIAVPKKKDKDEEPKKDEAPKTPKKVEGLENFSMRVSSQLVTVDVGVLSKDGAFIPNLAKEHFRVLEDGVPQTIASFNQIQAPITAVMLVEFSNNQYFYSFQIDSIKSSFVFAQTLKKEDWVAMISYDLKSHLLEDFTQDKRAIMGAVMSLQPGMAMSQETNLFDALYDTIDRLEGVEGRKYIVLITSGRDSFSKHTLDQTLKKVQASKDIAIYVVGTGKSLLNYAESHGLMRLLCPITEFNCEMTFLQGDNQVKTFAKMTGGKFYEPIFDGQYREIYSDISQTIRNQYAIAYHPTNSAQDGSYRKIKIELVGDDGHPLKMKDEKSGKEVKYQIVSREGYKAKQQVE